MQYICLLNHHILYLKLTQFSVNDISVKAGKTDKLPISIYIFTFIYFSKETVCFLPRKISLLFFLISTIIWLSFPTSIICTSFSFLVFLQNDALSNKKKNIFISPNPFHQQQLPFLLFSFQNLEWFLYFLTSFSFLNPLKTDGYEYCFF